MAIHEFLPRAYGRVQISLIDGSVHSGSFRTDILSPSAISAYFHGDARDLSLPIELIATIEPLAAILAA